MNSTINIPLVTDYYTLTQANALFNAIAAVLNNKLDVTDGDSSELRCNRQRVINVAEGEAASDGVTIAQVIRAKASGQVTKEDVDSQYDSVYADWIPIVVTKQNFSEAIRENILAIRAILPNKVTVFDTASMRQALDNGGQRLRLVGDGTHPSDLCNYRKAVEILNDPSI